MKKIQDLVYKIDEELDGAKDYAERYLDFKSQNKSDWASKFKQMANEELGHAMNIHDLAVYEIDKLRSVYTPPVEMEEKWERSHKEYIEKSAWIKQILTM